MIRRKDTDISADWIRAAFGWIVIVLVALLVVPTLIVVVIGFIQGTVPPSADGGIFGAGAGYPIFPPPFWLLWIPALGMLALSIVTWRYPGQFMDSVLSARWDLAIVSFVGATTTLGAAVSFGAPYLEVVLAAVVPWVLSLLILLARAIWDAIADAIEAFRPRSRATERGSRTTERGTRAADRRGTRTATPAREAIPALRFPPDNGRWHRSRQHLKLIDPDPRAVVADVFDSATNERGFLRALMRSVDGEDAAPSRSTSFRGALGDAVRTVRPVRTRDGERIMATWHWDDGQRAVLMTAFDLEPDRFIAVEAVLDDLAREIHIGTT